MAKYRKLPVVVEAEQYWPGKQIDGVCYGIGVYQGDDETVAPKVQPHIHTLEGNHYISPGDWIITGIAGEKYPCKPDIFEKLYERVDDGD